MTNVYDRLDLVANTAGIAFAIALDIVVTRMGGGKSARHEALKPGSGAARDL